MTTSPASRRELRERAFSILYEADIKDDDPVDVLDSQPVPADDFVRTLVAGVAGQVGELDAGISAVIRGWRIERLSPIDRAILRLGLFELREETAPPAVVINEAVELAKRYSGDDSPRFVNGVLGTLAADGA